MIRTSNHNNCKTDKYRLVSISRNKGKDVNYQGECFPNLAPGRDFWYVWHNNIGTIDELDNNKYYIEQYYDTVLSKLEPLETYKKLDSAILLCYEDSYEFCHRHIVAAWFELYLDVKVPDVKIEDEKVEEQIKPLYIKGMLESIIKEKIDMNGFNSLRELYLSQAKIDCEKTLTKRKEANN